MTDIWSFLLQTLTASGAAVLLLAVKAVLRDKLSPRWQFGMWGLLALVLLLPAGQGGRYVLVNWPLAVEALKSALTGEFGTLTRVLAPVPFPVSAPPRTVWDWLYVVYGLGVLFLLAWYALAYIRLRLALRKGRSADMAPVRVTAEKYGLPACSAAVEVEGLPSAFVCGVFRPVLALPAGVETNEKVILHELLHLRHRDVIWGLVICFFRCLHWCNPLLWLCADRAGNDLESLCDQRVLERLEGEERREYGKILLSMANEKYARAPGTSSAANGGKNIRCRIQAIARFRRYPAGMGLVSVCIALVLAVPLLVGVRAEAAGNFLPFFDPVVSLMAVARTTPCTTCAGAFDAYAKAVMAERLRYRAMCAPLSEQDDLAQECRRAMEYTHWDHCDFLGLGCDVLPQSGYQIYNLRPAGENAYEGLLALTLVQAPEGMEWSGVVSERWMAVQPLRAEKEGARWVILPQGEFTALQGDVREGGNLGLPAWEYTAPAGDFTLRMRWQTASQVDSYGEPDWTGYAAFNMAPVPNGAFTTWFHQVLLADYTGRPEDRENYTSIAISYASIRGGEPRPVLEPAPLGSGVDFSGSSNQGTGFGGRALDWDWEDSIYLCGGGSSRDGNIDPPDGYAADLYLNGKKTAELTLLPAEGAGAYD